MPQRQGSILSPSMFNVYLNDLSKELCTLPFGCYINDTCFNHLLYADDTVIIAPSPAALQTLMDTCSRYIKDNDLKFNVKKSKCMMLPTKKFIDVECPTFYIDGTAVNNTTCEKYLGYFISSDCCDDDSIFNVIKGLYSRGNMLKRHFIDCDIPVKLQLFNSYCSSFYCCSLWCNFKNTSLQRMKISHNNAFRFFLGIPRSTSVSQEFLKNGLSNFNVLRRKSVFSLLKRVLASHNSLIVTIVTSIYFLHSTLFKQWKLLLYT